MVTKIKGGDRWFPSGDGLDLQDAIDRILEGGTYEHLDAMICDTDPPLIYVEMPDGTLRAIEDVIHDPIDNRIRIKLK